MKPILAISVAFSLSACATVNHEPARPIKMGKGSAVDLRTQYDAAELVWNSMQRFGCRQTETIFPEVVEKSSDFQTADGYVAQGRVKERWVAHGCNMEIPYLVDFIANKRNAGGTDIYIRREGKGN